MVDDDVITKAQMVALISNQQEQMKLLTQNLLRVTTDLLEVKEQLAESRNSNPASLNGTFGVNYIRWGRTECPETADKLYQGELHYSDCKNEVG